MDSKLEVILSSGNITLKSINENDIDCLRMWKNSNREAFFYKNIITKSDQEKWYDKYISREDDYIFIVLYNKVKIGCIGYREINGYIDIYNVILEKDEFSRKGLMSRALKMFCSYLFDNIKKDITAKVLYENQAKLWYMKNSFRKISEVKDYVLLKLDINNFDYLKYNLRISKIKKGQS